MIKKTRSRGGGGEDGLRSCCRAELLADVAPCYPPQDVEDGPGPSCPSR